MEADISENPKHSTNLQETIVHEQMCRSASNLQPPTLTWVRASYLGVVEPTARRRCRWRWPPTPASSEGSNGNNPDNAGKFNLHERYPDNGAGKKDFGA